MDGDENGVRRISCRQAAFERAFFAVSVGTRKPASRTVWLLLDHVVDTSIAMLPLLDPDMFTAAARQPAEEQADWRFRWIRAIWMDVKPNLKFRMSA